MIRTCLRALGRFLPAILYALTWCSTFGVGLLFYGGGSILKGLAYAVPLMTILTLHELGHYLQMRRYGIASTPPLFLPFPLPPLGTFGAFIRMKSAVPNRRALFDMGISGPLAGLTATIVFLFIGLSFSTIASEIPEIPPEGALEFGEPLILKWAAAWTLGYTGNEQLLLHPTAIAAWAGLLLTTLNLFPTGQLDGGHVFYALLGKRARRISLILFALGCVCVACFRLWNWIVFLVLIALIGLRRPSTVDDARPLGVKRAILGWATLAFLFIGFTPTPLKYVPPPEEEEEDVPAAVAVVATEDGKIFSETSLPF